jgi:hypothetical protein
LAWAGLELAILLPPPPEELGYSICDHAQPPVYFK